MTTEEKVVDVSQDWVLACDVQQGFMQTPCTTNDFLDCSARCRQVRALGGDCYNFIPLKDDCLTLVVGDASGKGLAAALMIANVQSSLRTAALFTGDDLVALFKAVNHQAYYSSPANRYATLLYGVLDNAKRTLRRWQKACDGDDAGQGAGRALGAFADKLREMPRQLEPLPKMVKLSRTDPDSRFLRERGGRFVLGYTGEITVSQDHFIVAARVTQNASDQPGLVPMVEQVERNCGQAPQSVLADSSYYSNQNVAHLSERGIDVYVPDSNLAHELNGGPPASTVGRMQPSDSHLRAMRQKLRTSSGRQRDGERKTMVEPVFGVLKEQRGMRRFRLRGLNRVSTEWMLAALAFNLGRLYASR